jgi:hypothetical protein
VSEVKFVDAGKGDYRLTEASPCIDKGANLSEYGISTGLAGNSRSSGKAFDQGAYEYAGSAKSSNKAPSISAGADKTLTLPSSSVKLEASATDSDGSITSYQWSKKSGPSATMAKANTRSLELSKLVEGSYVFSVTVKDNEGASASDEVRVKVEKKPEDIPEAPSPSPSSASGGLNYSYYEGSWTKLPDFSKLKPKKQGTADNFTLAPRSRSNHFGFKFEGYINIKRSGKYTFYTTSDDGSILYINGKKVVKNDGLHPATERSGSVRLSAGKHEIKVVYFEGKGDETLRVKYAGPGVDKKSIPNSVLSTGKSSGGTATPVKSTGKPLTYAYYEGEWGNLPDFSKLKPKATGTVSNFTLSPRKSNDYYAFKFDGEIAIATSGTYTFYLASDDGSQLFIDGKRVVDNGGLHAREEKSGSVTLSKGKHDIRITYFERKGKAVLDVYYKGPGFSKKRIPDSVLGGDSNGRTLASVPQKSSLNGSNPALEPKIAMYPNPASNFLTISNVSDAVYSIISASGKIMAQGGLTDHQRLNVSLLPDGLYIVRVQQEGIQLTERILIQH